MNTKKAEISNNFVLFDKPYSKEKNAEGLAIQWAVVSGACNRCGYLKECENCSNFVFPKNAPCMQKKAEFLRSDNNGE